MAISTQSLTPPQPDSRNQWPTVRFGDVVRNVKVKVDPFESGLERYVAGEHMETDDLHIRKWGTIGDGYLGPAFHRKFVVGQTLYGSRRTYLRKVAVAEFDGVCANTTFVFEPKDEQLIPELLPFIMQTDAFVQHSMQQSRGSTNPYVTFKDLAWYEFPLPPLDEQRRIAEILWAADAAIDKLTIARSRIEQCKAIYLTNIFDPACDSQKSSQMIQLGSVLTYASDGPFGSKLKTKHYSEEGVRVVRLQNIGTGFFLNDDEAYISESYYRELARYALQSGDVIVAGLGDETHQVGRACIVPTYLGSAINKADCFCLRAESFLLDNTYLMYFLNSSFGRRQILQRAQGTTRLRINVTNLKTVSMPLPSIGHQREISKTLQLIDEAGEKLQNQLRLNRNLSITVRETLIAQ